MLDHFLTFILGLLIEVLPIHKHFAVTGFGLDRTDILIGKFFIEILGSIVTRRRNKHALIPLFLHRIFPECNPFLVTALFAIILVNIERIQVRLVLKKY